MKKTTASIEPPAGGRVARGGSEDKSVLIIEVHTALGKRYQAVPRAVDGLRTDEVLFEAASLEAMFKWLKQKGYERDESLMDVWVRRRQTGKKRTPTVRQAAALLLLDAVNNVGKDMRARLANHTTGRFNDAKILKVSEAIEKLLGNRRRVIEDIVRKYLNKADRV